MATNSKIIQQSKLESTFWNVWRIAKLSRKIAIEIPDPVPEFEFHADRKWRLDFAWPDLLIGVELDGGVRYYRTEKMGRHQRASGIAGDNEKRNAAVELGWDLFVFCNLQLDADPTECVLQVARHVEKWLPET